MRKKVLVRGPFLTRSGYGEHARFVVRALRSREDLFNIYLIPVGWGQTGWIANDDEEREWLDRKVSKTALAIHNKEQFDMSVQVTIPNEWEKMAPINIGVTAGIETTKVAPVWLERANMMDKVITISEHSKEGFVKTVFEGQNKQTGAPMTLKCDTPVEIVNYPIKSYDNLPELNLELDFDFNYLVVAQNGPRKNLGNTIKWFVEENIDQKVGLVVKAFIKNGAILDRQHAEAMISGLLKNYPERKCKVYLLHGDMSDEEMHSLYVHPKIKALVSLSHGEGYGLPIFEASYSALPVITVGWSGQCDFLYAPYKGKDKKKKGSMIPYFSEVDYTLADVPKESVWDGVIIADSMWCYPNEGSAKMKMRQVRKNYDKWKKKANTLQKWLFDNFTMEQQCERFVEHASIATNTVSENEIDEMFNKLIG